MNVKDIINAVTSKFPSRYVEAIMPYKNSFLVCAPEKSLGKEDFADPFFIVSPNGSIKHFLPMSDIHGFAAATRGRVLYKNGDKI